MVLTVRLALDLYCLDCFGGLRRLNLVFDTVAASFAHPGWGACQSLVEAMDVVLAQIDEDIVRCTLAWAPRFECGLMLGGNPVSAMFHLREMLEQ
jgi:hypothetical protein